jgi:hypothetical protein
MLRVWRWRLAFRLRSRFLAGMIGVYDTDWDGG